MSLVNSPFFMASTGAALAEGSSLRFEDGDSAYLSWTPASAGNRKTWTYSTWIKRGNLGGTQLFGINSGESYMIRFSTSNRISCNFANDTATNYFADFTRDFRDVGAWYHFVVSCDTTQSTASNRVKIYVNGELQTITGGATTIPQNRDTDINVAAQHRIGAETGNRYYSDGYIANTCFIDGQQLDPTSFGEYEDTLWKPKSDADIQALTFGTNGFYLAFEDSSAIGDDTSGNANDWTANNLVATDVVPDSPVTNFATLNVGDKRGTVTVSQGNTKAVISSAGNITGTIAPASGKWYWETLLNDITNAYAGLQIVNGSGAASTGYSQDAVAINNQGDIYFDLSAQGFAYEGTPVWTNGDILGCAYDADNNKIWWSLNGQWYSANASTESAITKATVEAGNNAYDLSSQITYGVPFYGSSATSAEIIANFGQDSSFAGNKTPQGNTDNNGQGDFYYAPPSGFLALTRNNLSTPDILDPADYFNTLLWTGNGASSRSLTGVGFQPDFLWTKNRSSPFTGATSNHYLNDSVRGSGTATLKLLFSNSTSAEVDGNSLGIYGGTSSLDADGFTVEAGSNGNENRNSSGVTYVAWNWLAGGTAVSNTDGTATSQVSANTDAGFSIVSYTGTSSATTIGHGLNSAPEMLIVKNRDQADKWAVYHKYSPISGVGAETDYLSLNETSAAVDSSAYWNDTAPTSSVFTVGQTGPVNQNNEDYIAYCFHSVDGYSKLGSYTGNGSTDGPFVHCGFRPAWVMVKRTDASGNAWYIWDNKRNSYNANGDNNLWANNSSAENTNDYPFDALSNGFKVRATTSNLNTSGATYIFLAFAEAPFRNANAR